MNEKLDLSRPVKGFHAGEWSEVKNLRPVEFIGTVGGKEVLFGLNRLRNTPAETRTPLSATTVPMWAVWVRLKSWADGCRDNFHVTTAGIVVARWTMISWDGFANDGQLGDTDGNWYDATVEGVAKRGAK